MKHARGQRKTVYEAIKKVKEISVPEISTSTKVNYNTIRGAVVSLTNAGLIERTGRGKYRIKQSA